MLFLKYNVLLILFSSKNYFCLSYTLYVVVTVVATTHWNGTYSMLTLAKLTKGYLVVEIIRELDKEPLLHCSSIYINTT